MNVVKLLSVIDVFPGQKTYLMLLCALGMVICQMMGYHTFTSEAWTLVGINSAIFWKMGQERKVVKGKK